MNWTRILTILLVVLASCALLYIAFSVFSRFTHAVVLFVLGALAAYVLTPLVNRLQIVLRVRALAIFVSYVVFACGLFLLGVLLFTPFIQQSQSLVNNLHTPSAKSLQPIKLVARDTRKISDELQVQLGLATAGSEIGSANAQQTQADILDLQRAVDALRNGTVCLAPCETTPPRTIAGRIPPNPKAQTAVPRSYWQPIALQVLRLSSDYAHALRSGQGVNSASFRQAIRDAGSADRLARKVAANFSSTPILLLRVQSWLDDRGFAIDVHDRFGDVARQISSQGTNILDNAITIIEATANMLLNFVLVLIIAFYFLLDGRRIIRGGLHAVPNQIEEQVWFFMVSLDKVLGGYVRGTLFLSGLAGLLAGAGAAALGVPYPLLIGIVTFLLEIIPVIGPMVAFVPAVAISLFFNPFLTTVFLFAWFTLFQQVVTNFLGPRVMGNAVGIHPLEAIAAVLVGYPLGGFLGAFLAVPVAGVLHILVRELYAYFALGRALPTAPVEGIKRAEGGPVQEQTVVSPGSETRTAAS